MSSVLQYPAALYPATAHNPSTQITQTGKVSLHKTLSHDGYVRPLLRFFRNPSVALERLAEEFTSPFASVPAPDEYRENRRQLLYLQLRNADNFEEWRAAAFELDEIEGNNGWRHEVESDEYDYALVESRLRELDEARNSNDPQRMLFLIRTSLTRHPGGIYNLKLYKHTHLGTKDLIERYIKSALDTLSCLTDRNQESGIEPRLLLEQVLAARQAFGRSALLLSGGGTFGMNHIGVVKSLWEANLLPRIVSGASAGSIVCAVLCAKTDEEMPEVIDKFCYGDLQVFTREADDGTLAKLARFMKFGALFDIENLTLVMRNLIGDMTFQEAYNRTRRILNICVSSAGLYELPRLLNYVTAPNVIIWSAVAASCSVPFIFSPASLSAKDPTTGNIVPWNPSPQRWIDGSVDNDLPMTRLAEMFNVNHFIVSQVNPHVVPFLAKEEDQIATQATAQYAVARLGSEWTSKMANLAKDEALHRMQFLAELGVIPNILTKAKSVLSQKYSGDITILPAVSFADMPKVLKNPTTEFMLAAMLCGERATWPKLSRIQNHCAIELALDDTVQQLRARVAFSPSQVDLRLNSVPRPLSRAGSEGGKSRRSKRKSLKANNGVPLGRRKTAAVVPPGPVGTAPISTVDSKVEPPLKSAPLPAAGKRATFSLNLTTVGPGLDNVDDDDILSSTSSPFSETSDSEITTADDYFSPSTDDETYEPPQRRRLFPYASQPATPYNQHQQNWYFSSIPKASSKYRPPTPARAPSPVSGIAKAPSHLTMTTASSRTAPQVSTPQFSMPQFSTPRSSTELQGPRSPYLQQNATTPSPKTTTHSRRGSRSNSLSRPASLSGSGTTTPRPFSAGSQPSNPDIAGMTLQHKRSLSTGIRGLRPPSSHGPPP